MSTRLAICLLPAVVLAACVGPLVEHIKVDTLQAADILAGVRTVSASELQGKSFVTLQPLSATSCKNKMWDPDPSNADATNQLKIKAARVNANALSNLYCEAPKGVDLAVNCWTHIVCHASAIRIEN